MVLALAATRVGADFAVRSGEHLVLLETFVETRRELWSILVYGPGRCWLG